MKRTRTKQLEAKPDQITYITMGKNIKNGKEIKNLVFAFNVSCGVINIYQINSNMYKVKIWNDKKCT